MPDTRNIGLCECICMSACIIYSALTTGTSLAYIYIYIHIYRYIYTYYTWVWGGVATPYYERALHPKRTCSKQVLDSEVEAKVS